MTWDYQKQLNHLTWLALSPGWKAYAWHRAKEIEAEGGMWAGMSTDLKQSVLQSQTKPPLAAKK